MTTSADISLTFDDSLSIGLPQPLGVSAGITEIPKISIGLDPLTIEPLTVSAGITEIPKISIGLDPLTIEPLTIEPLTITVNPLDLSIGITELPSIRVHLPARFTSALSILGHELFCLHLCGEAQLITEPYEPNPCERGRDEHISNAAEPPQPPSAKARE
jgi:hypothetical protein